MDIETAYKTLGYPSRKSRKKYRGKRIVKVDECQCGTDNLYALWYAPNGFEEWIGLYGENKQLVLQALDIIRNDREE